MHLLNQRTLGILIIVLLGILIVIKRAATGTILEKPKGGFLLWLTNIFNLFFLLIANPLAGLLCVMDKMAGFDPSYLEIHNGSLLLVTEICGVLIYVSGFVLMSWALIILGKNYQLGGVDPRASDILIMNGPYKSIRHPMYTAALCIALGLSLLIQSVICFIAFGIYLALIILLIPKEEETLVKAYGDSYVHYRQNVNKLVPF